MGSFLFESTVQSYDVSFPGENQQMTQLIPVNLSAIRVKKMDFPSPGSFCFASHSDFWKSRRNLRNYKTV